MTFFALAALADPDAPQRWLRLLLAGAALGMAVTEGADVGAIYSLYVAAFVIYQTWTLEGSHVKNLAWGFGRLALVATCAAVLAAQSIHGLIGTSIVGIKGTQQDAKTKAPENMVARLRQAMLDQVPGATGRHHTRGKHHSITQQRADDLVYFLIGHHSFPVTAL